VPAIGKLLGYLLDFHIGTDADFIIHKKKLLAEALVTTIYQHRMHFAGSDKSPMLQFRILIL